MGTLTLFFKTDDLTEAQATTKKGTIVSDIAGVTGSSVTGTQYNAPI